MKIYISGSQAGNTSFPKKVGEYISKKYERGVEIVYPSLPWNDNSEKEMLACDILIICPPDSINYNASVNVGKGQFEMVKKFWNKPSSAGIFVINNISSDDDIEASLVSEDIRTNSCVLENTGGFADWQKNYGWIYTDEDEGATSLQEWLDDVGVKWKEPIKDSSTLKAGDPGTWVVFTRKYGGVPKNTISKIIKEKNVLWPVITTSHLFKDTPEYCRLSIPEEGVVFLTEEEAKAYVAAQTKAIKSFGEITSFEEGKWYKKDSWTSIAARCSKTSDSEFVYDKCISAAGKVLSNTFCNSYTKKDFKSFTEISNGVVEPFLSSSDVEEKPKVNLTGRWIKALMNYPDGGVVQKEEYGIIKVHHDNDLRVNFPRHDCYVIRDFDRKGHKYELMPKGFIPYSKPSNPIDSFCVKITTENKEVVKKWFNSSAYFYSVDSYYGIDTKGNKHADKKYSSPFAKVLTTEEFYAKIGHVNDSLVTSWNKGTFVVVIKDLPSFSKNSICEITDLSTSNSVSIKNLGKCQPSVILYKSSCIWFATLEEAQDFVNSKYHSTIESLVDQNVVKNNENVVKRHRAAIFCLNNRFAKRVP